MFSSTNKLYKAHLITEIDIAKLANKEGGVVAEYTTLL